MNTKYGKIGECCWNCRYEILGLILLIIATLLTIIAWDSFGIVAMFIVGLVLVAHKHFCYIGCHSSCHMDECDAEECTDETHDHTIVKETVRKKKES